MDAKFDHDTGADARIVYVRPVAVSDLPRDVQAQAEGKDLLYALHDADGARIALAIDKGAAFAYAWQNDLAPVSVH